MRMPDGPEWMLGVCALMIAFITVAAASKKPTPQVPYIILDERELDVRTQAASMVADVENAHGRGREKRVLTGWVALPRDQYDAMRRGK